MNDAATFKPASDETVEGATLIEGFPGHGLVASIAVDHLTEALGLEHHGDVRCASFPQVVAFDGAVVRDPVRVHAGREPPLLVVQSDLPLAEDANRALARCLLGDLGGSFDRAVFLVGVPAKREDHLHEVRGVATTEDLRAELSRAGIEVPEGSGVVAGTAGALLKQCHEQEVPAAALVVRADPRMPDPSAAKVLLEDGLLPLLDLKIDTTALEEQAAAIQKKKAAVLDQLRQGGQGAPPGEKSPGRPSMYG